MKVFSLCFFLPICNYQLYAIYLLFIIPGYTFVLTLFLSCLPLLSSMHLHNTVHISSQGEDLQMFLKITFGNTADIIKKQLIITSTWPFGPEIVLSSISDMYL